MIVTLNGLVFNDPTTGNGIYLDEPLDGLSLPPVRTSSGDYSGRDGGYVGAQFYGSRLITINGEVFSSSTALVESTRRTIQAALAQSSVTMQITTSAGNQYVIYCTFDSLTMPINRGVVRAPFQITLVASDPLIYDNSSGGSNTATITRSSGGGLTWPLSWPLHWASGASTTTVNNSGDVAIRPVITLTGVMTAPLVSNATTGQFFSMPSLTSAPGDVLVIDMLNRAVTLNGGSVLSFATTTSTWWSLLPGNNSISLTTGNSSDTVTGTVTWRSGYRGI